MLLGSKQKLAYALAATISSMGWGLHFSFVTRYLAVELGGGSKVTIAFVGIEWLFTLLGILAGRVVSVAGRGRLFCSALLR